MYTFRKKIQILRAILKEYAIYFKYFKSANCYARGKNIIITFEDGYRYGLFLKRKFPKRETDKVIARYRAKLHNEKKKHLKLANEHKRAFIYSIQNLK